MNRKRILLAGVASVVVLLFLCTSVVFATGVQEEAEPEYPTRPITIVCPWKVGGAAEIGARIFGQHLSEELGVRVDVISKTGGTGASGTVFVKNSKPDGYTLLQSYIGPLAQVPLYLGEECQYDPLKDFATIGQVASAPVVFLVREDSPWNSLQDFIEDARKNPGKYKCGAGGQLSLHALFAGMFFDTVGIDVPVVAYPGCLMGVPDLLGGNLHILAGNPTGVALYPQLKGIAVLMDERWPTIPDVPTLNDLGYDLKTVPTWQGYSVPTATPEYIQQILIDASAKIVNSDKFKKEMEEKIQVLVVYKDSEEFFQLWKDSLESMKPAVQWLKEKQKKEQ